MHLITIVMKEDGSVLENPQEALKSKGLRERIYILIACSTELKLELDIAVSVPSLIH